jgi:deoxyribose-phosphate aldolase
MTLRVEELAKTIDHPLQTPAPTPADVVRLCDEACAHHFAAVCVGAHCVRLAAERLRGCDIKVAGVIAAADRKAKAALAVRCLSAGAAEIEIALGTEEMLAGAFRSARNDLAAVVRALRTANVNTGRGYVLVKVAVDCDRLDDARKRLACLIVDDVDADFVEAVTRSPGIAALRELELFRDGLPERVGVKVTVPVARAEEAEELVTAGVARIGTPHAVAMMRSAPTLVEVVR